MNHEKAYELHLSAANRGMPRAQYNTAVQLFEGKGVEQVCVSMSKCIHVYVEMFGLLSDLIPGIIKPTYVIEHEIL